MRVSVLDAQHTIFEGPVSQAILPGVDGEINLLDDHETVYVALAKGSIRLQPITQEITRRFAAETETAGPLEKQKIGPIFINRGLARMKNNILVILVE